jgi:hypothetical protein
LLLHNPVKYVFVTASPVLTSEVRRFYMNLKESLINYLKAKEINAEKRKLQKQHEE